MLKVLSTLANGGSLREIADAETKGKLTTPEERSRALRIQLPKWCKRIYDAMITEYGVFRRSTIETATDNMIRHVLRNWPGVQFPRDIEVFRYAIRQHVQRIGNRIPK